MSRSLLTQGSRHLPPWLILGVRQNRKIHMDAKGLSFSAYDFLGYLMPGALLILLMDASFAYHMQPASFSYAAILERYSSKEIGLIFPFIIVAYIVGHIISFLSAISVERYAIWVYGHPSKYLLNIKAGGFWGVAGSNRPASLVLRMLMAAFLLPITCLEFTFGYCLRLRENYVAPFDSLLREAIWTALNRLVRSCGVKNPASHGSAAEHDFAKLAMHHALEVAPNHVFTLRNYVALYGFIRTVCFVMILIFWSLALHGYHMGWGGRLWVYTLGPVGVLCFVVFLSFMKFFQRYYEEALFAVTIVASERKN